MKNPTYVCVSSWHFQKAPREYGLSLFRFNAETGGLELAQRLEPETLFNFTYFDAETGLLYALAETADLPGLRGGGGGQLYVYRLDFAAGKLTRIAGMDTWCPDPCYLAIDPKRRFLVIAHHSGHACVTKLGCDAYGRYYPVVDRDDAAVELVSLKKDGTPGRILDAVKHTGCGPAPRQTHAHPHSAVRSPSGALYAVCDKGNDTVRLYRIDAKAKRLVLDGNTVHQTPGKEPRYCVFHPTKPWFYHNNENAAVIDRFRYEENGTLHAAGTYDVLPPDCPQQEDILAQQGLVIDGAGEYLYNLTFGPNILTVFSVSQEDGSLTPVQHLPIPEKWPRGCALSPDGRFLLVCCVTGDAVLVYRVNADGTLSETEQRASAPCASYITFCSES